MTLLELLGDAYKDGMTIEDVTSALEGIEMPVPDNSEVAKLKGLLTKANSEAAEYKKQLKTKMSEDERLKQEHEEYVKELEENLSKLQRQTMLAENEAKFIALGYEESLAKETAQALIDNDFAKIFANQKKHMDNMAAQIKADLLEDTPKPDGNGGSNNSNITKEAFANMGYLERLDLLNENPDLYNAMTGEENGNSTC